MNDKWFELDIKQAEEKFNTSSEAGLSKKAAAKLLADNGSNIFFRAGRVRPSEAFRKALFDPSTIILLLSCVAAIFLGRAGTGLFVAISFLLYICAVVAVNILISLSEKKSKNVLTPYAKVIRDGKIYHVRASGLVVGDLICLVPGDIVPADSLVVFAEKLQTSFETATESLIMNKAAQNLTTSADSTLIYKRTNVVCAGSVIVGGVGRAIVGAVGDDTYSAAAEFEKNTVNDSVTSASHSAFNKTALMLNVASLGLIVVYTLLSLIFKSSSGVFDAFLSAAVISALTSNGLASMSERAVTLSVLLNESCSYSKGIVFRNSDAVEKLAGVKTLIVTDNIFMHDGNLYAVDCYTGGIDYDLRQNKVTLPEAFLRNVYMAVQCEPVNNITGFINDIRFLRSVRELLGKSEKDEGKLRADCSLIGYVRGGASVKFDTVVYSSEGKTWRCCRSFDSALISACSHCLSAGGISIVTPDVSEALHSKYSLLKSEGYIVMVTACAIGTNLVFDGMIAFSKSKPNEANVADYVQGFKDSGVRVILTSESSPDDVTKCTNSGNKGFDVFDCNTGDDIMEIARNDNIVFVNNITPDKLTALVEALSKGSKVGISVCNQDYSDAAAVADVKIGCTCFDTAKISDVPIPLHDLSKKVKLSEYTKSTSDIVLSQPLNRSGLYLLSRCFSCLRGKDSDCESYRRYFILSFFIRSLLIILLAFCRVFISASAVIAAGILTDVFMLAVLVSPRNGSLSQTPKKTDSDWKSQLLLSGAASFLIFLVSRILSYSCGDTSFLFASLISVGITLTLTRVLPALSLTEDSDRTIVTISGLASVILLTVVITALPPIAKAFSLNSTALSVIAAAIASPLIFTGCDIIVSRIIFKNINSK